MLPTVEKIDSNAFAENSKLEYVRFNGYGPVFEEEAFYRTITTVYYPENNDTWTADIMRIMVEQLHVNYTTEI